MVALLVVTAGLVAPVAATGGDDTATAAESVSAAAAGNTFSGCRNTPIDQPGVYNLTGGVTNSTQQYCINITADDVVLDGMAHTIQGVGAGSDTLATTPVGIYVTGTNVTIKNITIDHWETGVAYRGASSHIYDSKITDIDLDGVNARDSTVEVVNSLITADDDGLQASNSELTVFSSRITNDNDTALQRGVRVNNHTYFVMTKTTIENAAITGILANTFSEAYLWSNTIVDSRIGVELRIDSHSDHFTDNVIRGSDRHAVHLELGANVTKFRNNTLQNVGEHGLFIEESYANVTESNFTNISGSGVVVGPSAPATETEIHGSDFAQISNYGVLNRNESAVVNATGNYWGDSSGPSSDSSDPDAPFADPVSGTLADGTGATVSEGSTAGVSNVHFDPWQTTTPTISSCTDVTFSGQYVLNQDVTNSNQQYCINITADDVVLDGMGHTIQGVGGGGVSTPPVGIYVTGENVTITNVTVTDWQTGIAYQDASAHLIEANVRDIDLDGIVVQDSTLEVVGKTVTADDDGIQSSNSTVTVVDTEITNGDDTALQRGLRVNGYSDLLLIDSTIENAAITGLLVNTFSEARIWNDTFVDSRIGIEVSSRSTANVTGTEIHGSDRSGIRVEWHSTAEIDQNTVTNVDGSAVVIGPNASADRVDVHRNNFVGVAEYGVLNRNESAVVNATGNYWGDSSGPSSDSSDPDAPFADPVSGTLADGTGATVSEGSTAGVSNVHFDPYRTSIQSTTEPTTATTTTKTTSETPDQTTGETTVGTTEGSSGDSPGFTPLVVVVALLAFALLAVRHET